MRGSTAGSLLLSVAVTALLAIPVLAAELKGQIKAVDTTANTITVTEGGKDSTFSTTPDTKFLNVKGAPLANGIKSGDLKPGRRVVINYETKGDKAVASRVRLRASDAPPRK